MPTQAFLNELQRTVNSITMSTSIDIYNSIYQVHASGLCSGYVSHQEIEYIPLHSSLRYDQYVLSSCPRYTLFVSFNSAIGEHMTTLAEKHFELQLLPIEFITPILDLLNRYSPSHRGRWSADICTLITVGLPRCEVLSWNEDRSPVVSEIPEFDGVDNTHQQLIS